MSAPLNAKNPAIQNPNADQASIDNKEIGAVSQGSKPVDKPVPVVEARPDASPAAPATAETIVWPDPQSLPNAHPPVMPFDYAMMPFSLRGGVEDIVNRMQCPPDYVAVAAMVALSAVVGRKIGIRPKRYDDWLVIGNLWGAIVGMPGVMKSPAISEAMRPLKRLEAAAQEGFPEVLQAWKNDQELLKIHYKAAKYNALKAAKVGNEIVNVPVDPKGNKEPQPARYVVNDFSVEALEDILLHNPNGVLAYRDELIGLLKWLDKPGNEGARSFFLQAWSGTEGYTVDRIGRGLNMRIEACCLSILGSIQPSVIEEYLMHAVDGGGGDGLMSRFQLLVFPDVSKTWVNVDVMPDNMAMETTFEVFERLDKLDPLNIGQVDDNDAGGIPFLRFDDDAQKLFNEWRAGFEPRLRSDNEHPAFVSHLSKYRKLVPGLALLIHLADNEAGPVGKVALLMALSWAEYLESHAQRAYASVMLEAAQNANALLRRIQHGDVPNPFAHRRDVYLKHWAHLSTRQKAGEAVQMLCDFGYLQQELVQETGGRPKIEFWINPKVVTA